MIFATTTMGFFAGIGLTVLLIGIVCWSVISLARNAAKVYADMDKFHQRARGAESLEELAALRQEIVDYGRKYCHHRTLGARAREEIMYVEGRKRAL